MQDLFDKEAKVRMNTSNLTDELFTAMKSVTDRALIKLDEDHIMKTASHIESTMRNEIRMF